MQGVMKTAETYRVKLLVLSCVLFMTLQAGGGWIQNVNFALLFWLFSNLLFDFISERAPVNSAG